MRTTNDLPSFEISVSGRGAAEALYIRLSPNPVASTKELVENVLVVDYDSDGGVVGVEVLRPISPGKPIEFMRPEHSARAISGHSIALGEGACASQPYEFALRVRLEPGAEPVQPTTIMTPEEQEVVSKVVIRAMNSHLTLRIASAEANAL